jgi:hypothetical protein
MHLLDVQDQKHQLYYLQQIQNMLCEFILFDLNFTAYQDSVQFFFLNKK